VSGDRDGRILTWDVPSGRAVGELTGPSDGISSVVVDRDAQLLVVGSEDDVVWSWDLRLETWLEGACRVAGRNLTADEWAALRIDETPVAHCPEMEESSHEPASYDHDE
jgi:WD40 repeat protein